MDINLSEDRVRRLESEVDEIRKSQINVEKAIVKLTMLAEIMQKLEPRVKALEEFKYRAIGIMSVLMLALSIFGSKISSLLFG